MSFAQRSWVFIGGTGYESALWGAIEKPSVTMIGTLYDLTKEMFAPAPWAQGCFAEYLTPNYASLISEAKGIIHLSHSLLSCYLALDIAHVYNKPAWIFIPGTSWRLLFFAGGDNGCLACLQPYAPPQPALLWPRFSDEWVTHLPALWHNQPSQSLLWETPGTSHAVPLSKTCPLHTQTQPYLSGRMQPIVAVSCGENSVAITPSFERTIDLQKHLDSLKPHIHIKKHNAFFVEIEYERFSCLLFRQGRFIAKGTKEKNTALHLYRLLVGI